MFDEVEIGDLKDLGTLKLNVQPIFLGAWYHKVVAPIDNWLGLEAEIELGEFTPDEKRFNLDGKKRYMDNPGVYVGGKADLESDCGVGYNIMYDSTDTSYQLDQSHPKLGYRPFWRYIYKDRVEKDGCINVINVNSWNVTNPKEFGYYYFPGDVIRLKVYSPIPNYLQMRIEVVKPTTIEKYVNIRKRYHLKNDMPSTFYSPIFSSEGQGVKKAEFKRVNSIDQFGNEGKPTIRTNAKMSSAVWHNCYLYKMHNGKLYKYPFVKELQYVINAPLDDAFTIENYNENSGGEKVSIHPETSKYDK